MNAEHKAVELVKRFHGCTQSGHAMTHFERAQDCALICINEIMQSDEDEHPSDIKIQYWTDVKREVELMKIDTID